MCDKTFRVLSGHDKRRILYIPFELDIREIKETIDGLSENGAGIVFEYGRVWVFWSFCWDGKKEEKARVYLAGLGWKRIEVRKAQVKRSSYPGKIDLSWNPFD